MHAATVGACTHARSSCCGGTGRETWLAPSLWRRSIARRLCHKERGEFPPYYRPRNCDQQGFCDSGNSHLQPKTMPKAVSSLTRQGPARMGELWPVLAPLEALARACPAVPGKTCKMASISGQRGIPLWPRSCMTILARLRQWTCFVNLEELLF